MSTPVDLYTFYAAVSGFAIWAAGIRCAFERAVPTAAVMIVEEIISLIAFEPNHHAASYDDISSTHKILDQFCISKHHNKCTHKKQGIQKSGKESCNCAGYIGVRFFVYDSVN